MIFCGNHISVISTSRTPIWPLFLQCFVKSDISLISVSKINIVSFFMINIFQNKKKLDAENIFRVILPLPARRAISSFAVAVLAVANRPESQNREISLFKWNFNIFTKIMNFHENN